MSERTKIDWCDSTVNFFSGCTKVSEGCRFCYAEAQSERFSTFGKWGPYAKRKLHESAFKLAHRLNRTFREAVQRRANDLGRAQRVETLGRTFRYVTTVVMAIVAGSLILG